MKTKDFPTIIFTIEEKARLVQFFTILITIDRRVNNKRAPAGVKAKRGHPVKAKQVKRGSAHSADLDFLNNSFILKQLLSHDFKSVLHDRYHSLTPNA